MNRSSTLETSETQWARVRSMKDKDIRITKEHPEGDIKHIVKGIARRGLKPVPPKASISLRVDRDVLEWFRAQGRGYQSRMNAVLKAFKQESIS
jgi:uncharacterized protein (DUF4415 family)